MPMPEGRIDGHRPDTRAKKSCFEQRYEEPTMRSERFNFPNAKGEQLAAALDLPLGVPDAYALFAHCFTCGKDILAAKRIAERLSAAGVAVLRFDFTGLGSSEGEFAKHTFHRMSTTSSPPPTICAQRA